MPRLKRTPAAKADVADIWRRIALDNIEIIRVLYGGRDLPSVLGD